jgi:hypothetical protein
VAPRRGVLIEQSHFELVARRLYLNEAAIHLGAVLLVLADPLLRRAKRALQRRDDHRQFGLAHRAILAPRLQRQGRATRRGDHPVAWLRSA